MVRRGVDVVWCSSARRSALGGTLVQMNYANFGSVQIDLFDDLITATRQ